MSWTCPRCQQPVYFAEKVISLGKNWHRFCLKCEHCHSILSPGGHAEARYSAHLHLAANIEKACEACTLALNDPFPLPVLVPSTTGGHTATSLAMGLSLDLEGSTLVVWVAISTVALLPPLPAVFPSAPATLAPQGQGLASPRPRKWAVTPCSPTPDTAALANSCINSGFLMIELLPAPKRRTGPPYTKTFTGETSLCPGCGDPVYFAEKVMSLGRNWHRPCLRCQRCKKTLTAGSHAEHAGVPYCHIPCYGYLFGPKGVNIGNVGCYIYDPVEIRSK